MFWNLLAILLKTANVEVIPFVHFEFLFLFYILHKVSSLFRLGCWLFVVYRFVEYMFCYTCAYVCLSEFPVWESRENIIKCAMVIDTTKKVSWDFNKNRNLRILLKVSPFYLKKSTHTKITCCLTFQRRNFFWGHIF